MAIGLDYIQKVIARNNAKKQAGAQAAPAVFGKYTGFEGDAPTVARMQQNQRDQLVATAEQRKAAYQQQLEQHQRNMQQIRQREAIQTATQSGDKELQYKRVQEYLNSNQTGKELWNLEHGVSTNQNAAAQRRRAAEELRSQMSGAELSAYEAAEEAYDQYGGLYAAGKTVGDLLQGSLKNAAGNLMTAVQAVEKDYQDRADALETVYQQERSGNPFKVFAQVNSAYDDALKRQESERAQKDYFSEDTLRGLALAREGSEQLQRGAAGLNGGGKAAYDLASSMIANAPGMALALIPGVGPAASLGTLGAQAAGGKIDELSARGIENREALKRGVVSGIIESATEVLPVSN